METLNMPRPKIYADDNRLARSRTALQERGGRLFQVALEGDDIEALTYLQQRHTLNASEAIRYALKTAASRKTRAQT